MNTNFVENMVFDYKKFINYQDDPFAEFDENQVKEIGTLKIGGKSYCFTYNVNYVFANGLIILSTHNDKWTTVSTFDSVLKSLFGENYVSNICI